MAQNPFVEPTGTAQIRPVWQVFAPLTHASPQPGTGVAVAVGVGVIVEVGVTVGVDVGVPVKVGVAVGVTVTVGVGDGNQNSAQHPGAALGTETGAVGARRVVTK